MVEYLKRGKSEAEKGEDDAKARAVVEETLKDIETRGDVAVRELSKKFDGYAPESFRLTEQSFSKPDRVRWIEEKIKLGRVGEIEEVMGAAVFLASGASALVTGTSILVDGGCTAG